MKPLLIEIPKKEEASFQVKDYQNPYFHNPIHFHVALELTLILKGEGTRYVGDHIDSFIEGDLVLIGSNLPHQWRSDFQTISSKTNISNTNNINAKAIVVHFDENCFGTGFFKINESNHIQELFKKAKRGLKIEGKTRASVTGSLHNILISDGFERVKILIDILDILANSNELTSLADISYRIRNKTSEVKKLDKIYEYILSNLTRKITLSEIASEFHMSRTGFCRYFKTHTQKTFSRFVLESRISHACKLLHENKLSISEISYDCGFNNLSFFNREFKTIKGTTPLKYRKEFQQNYSPNTK